ncbi:hypothetical protein HZA96_04025 [Candidatus Woesearchaeota archaeon]|nr:hypothetical protein [Candidatus Woesearchaeota archaeon]
MIKSKALLKIGFILVIVLSIVLLSSLAKAEDLESNDINSNESNEVNNTNGTNIGLNNFASSIEINNKELQTCKLYNSSSECKFTADVIITKVNTTKYAYYYYIADLDKKIITKKQTIHIRGRNIVAYQILNISVLYDDIKQKSNQTNYLFVITGCGNTASIPIVINKDIALTEIEDNQAIDSNSIKNIKEKKITRPKNNKKTKEVTSKAAKKSQKSATKTTFSKLKDNKQIIQVKEIEIEQPLLNNDNIQQYANEIIKEPKMMQKKEKLIIPINNNLSKSSVNDYQSIQENISNKNNSIIYQSKTMKIAKVIPYVLLLFIIIIIIFYKICK